MALSPSSSRAPHATRVVTVLLWLVAVGNLAAVVYLWVHGGGIGLTSTLGGLLTSMGRLTALVGTYLVLVQVVLLARVPWIERRVGFDRLTVWHRRNGKVAVSLVVAHVPLIVAGYALTEHISIGKQISELLKSYPGMITAIIGTVILIVVVLSSLVIVRRRLPYESWYFVHISVYAGILLAYFHQIPTGNEFVAHPAQRDYWYALYVATLALVIVFRVISPALHFWRYRLRVSEVRRESPNVVSIYIEEHVWSGSGHRAASSFCGAFSRVGAGGRPIPSHSLPRRTNGRCGSLSRTSAASAAAWRSCVPGPGCSPRDRSANSQLRSAPIGQ